MRSNQQSKIHQWRFCIDTSLYKDEFLEPRRVPTVFPTILTTGDSPAEIVKGIKELINLNEYFKVVDGEEIFLRDEHWRESFSLNEAPFRLFKLNTHNYTAKASEYVQETQVIKLFTPEQLDFWKETFYNKERRYKEEIYFKVRKEKQQIGYKKYFEVQKFGVPAERTYFEQVCVEAVMKKAGMI